MPRSVNARPEGAPSYGRAVVEATLEDLGLELLDGNDVQWGRSRCPLHDDNSPSFLVHLEDGAWICLAGCGSGVDLARLVSMITGESPMIIRRQLLLKQPIASRSVLEMVVRRQENRTTRRVEPLFYERGEPPKYMLDRGFTEEFLRKWEVGWDPFLKAAVIPLRHGGKLVGLIRRLVDPPPGYPRYINTRGLEKDYLLGLDHITESKSVIVVEGPTDALWLQQHGYPGVAILGSSMSDAQAELIKKRFWKVFLAFDNDRAGRKATETTIEILDKLEVRPVRIPSAYKDVAECSAIILGEVFSHVL